MKKSYLWVGAACVVGLSAAALLNMRVGPAAHQEPTVPTRASAEKTLSEEPPLSTNAEPQPATSPPEPPPTPEPATSGPRDGLATTRFREARQCFSAVQDLHTAKANAADCKRYEGLQVHEQAYANCLNEDWSRRARDAEQKLSGCGDPTKISRNYFEATRDAAKAGDPDAQVCYLQSAFDTGNGTALTDTDNAEYKQLGPRLIDESLKRGDWRVVHLMTGRGGPISQLPGVGQQETRYKMTKLLRLGATGSYATGLDHKLRLLANPDIQPSAPLPKKTIQQADEWAQETYNAYFAGIPGTTGVVTACDQ
jgi:hypothetical protein